MYDVGDTYVTCTNRNTRGGSIENEIAPLRIPAKLSVQLGHIGTLTPDSYSSQPHQTLFYLARYMWIPYTDAVIVVRCNPFEQHDEPLRQVLSLKLNIYTQTSAGSTLYPNARICPKAASLMIRSAPQRVARRAILTFCSPSSLIVWPDSRRRI